MKKKKSAPNVYAINHIITIPLMAIFYNTKRENFRTCPSSINFFSASRCVCTWKRLIIKCSNLASILADKEYTMSCKVASPPNRKVCRAVCTSAVTIPERMSAMFKVRLFLEPVPVVESAAAVSADKEK